MAAVGASEGAIQVQRRQDQSGSAEDLDQSPRPDGGQRYAVDFRPSAGADREKHRRHGVNVQVVTDPVRRLLWISPALSGRAQDLTAARTHRIIQIWERQGIPRSSWTARSPSVTGSVRAGPTIPTNTAATE